MCFGVFIPYTEGIYVFYGVKGVVKIVNFGVNEIGFLVIIHLRFHEYFFMSLTLK